MTVPIILSEKANGTTIRSMPTDKCKAALLITDRSGRNIMFCRTILVHGFKVAFVV